MIKKLVVIIDSLKVSKMKKTFLYEMNFFVPKYSCLQNHCLGATAPRSPFSLSSTEFVEPTYRPKFLDSPLTHMKTHTSNAVLAKSCQCGLFSIDNKQVYSFFQLFVSKIYPRNRWQKLYLVITYCTQHRLSWEANSFSVRHANPHILWNSNIH